MLGPLFLTVVARPCDPCPEQLKGQACVCGGGYVQTQVPCHWLEGALDLMA